MRRGLQEHEPFRLVGIVRHMARHALAVTQRDREFLMPRRPSSDADCRRGTDHRTASPSAAGCPLVGPHPLAVEGFLRDDLRAGDRLDRAALCELRRLIANVFGIDPQQNSIRILVRLPFVILVPERIWELAGRQTIAEGNAEFDPIKLLCRAVAHLMLTAEHEQRHVHAGQHIRAELRQTGVREFRVRVFALPPPHRHGREARLYFDPPYIAFLQASNAA